MESPLSNASSQEIPASLRRSNKAGADCSKGPIASPFGGAFRATVGRFPVPVGRLGPILQKLVGMPQ